MAGYFDTELNIDYDRLQEYYVSLIQLITKPFSFSNPLASLSGTGIKALPIDLARLCIFRCNDIKTA